MIHECIECGKKINPIRYIRYAMCRKCKKKFDDDFYDEERKLQRITSKEKLGKFEPGARREININGLWAYTQLGREQQGKGKYSDTKGIKKAGHGPLLYLASSYGDWYDQNGNKLMGFLYFKQKNNIIRYFAKKRYKRGVNIAFGAKPYECLDAIKNMEITCLNSKEKK